jgi:hypothetical protein
MVVSHQHDKEAGMYLSPNTTALLVSDRRSARELAASRHRSLSARFRRATSSAPLVARPLPAPAGRTPAAAVCRAA